MVVLKARRKKFGLKFNFTIFNLMDNIVDTLNDLIYRLEEAKEESDWNSVDLVKVELLGLVEKLELGDSFMDIE